MEYYTKIVHGVVIHIVIIINNYANQVHIINFMDVIQIN